MPPKTILTSSFLRDISFSSSEGFMTTMLSNLTGMDDAQKEPEM